MNIQKIEIQNFKGIDYKNVNLEGANVYAIGPNAKGKTSFIDACFGQVKGHPLKEGERKGLVSIEVDDYICEFTFTAKTGKPKLNIFDKKGQPQKRPAELFAQLFGVHDFNIDEFLNLSAAKQVDKIKNIIGIDFSDVDAQRKEHYDERTFLTRRAKELDAKVQGIEHDPTLKKIDLFPLQEAITKRQQLNYEVSRISQKVEEMETEHRELLEKAEGLKKKIEAGSDWLEKNLHQSVEPLKNELDNAVKNNELIQANELNLQHREECAEAWKKVDELNDKIEAIDQFKKTELEAANMPVKGLTFDDKQLYLDGLPFETSTINTARRIIAGLEIEYALNQDAPVQIARFDGSLLDKNSLAEVEAWASEKGIQLFVELVDRNGEQLKIEVKEK